MMYIGVYDCSYLYDDISENLHPKKMPSHHKTGRHEISILNPPPLTKIQDRCPPSSECISVFSLIPGSPQQNCREYAPICAEHIESNWRYPEARARKDEPG